LITDSYDLVLSGNLWATSLPTTTGTLLPGQSALIPVQVAIPAGAADHAVDIAGVRVQSQGDAARAVQLSLTSTARTNSVTLTPTAQSKNGSAGATVIYQVQVVNTSPYSDTFTVAFSGAAWPFTPPGPLNIGPLPPGAGSLMEISVTIPAGTPNGNNDTLTITAVSQSDPARQATASLTTTTAGGRLFLPMLRKR
jgi:hypothetical protein